MTRHEQYLAHRDKNLQRMKKYRLDNIEECRIRDALYYQNNRDAFHDRMLRRTYGMTRDDYVRMLDKQKGVCAICKGPPGKKRLAVDHCHTTGVIRGLLCMNCNPGLGKFGDSPRLLEAAAKYLRKSKGQRA